MADLDSSKQAAQIDWEAFYASYRKPDFIPGYEILQKLGAGAFGLVFKARKHSIGKDYAVKFLKVDDANVRDAVLHELDTVRLFAQIDHPNLVSIEDMGHVLGIPYIVMGYAGEDTLARRLQEAKLPRAEAVRIFLQVCRGVQALHERMLVHFDLKPANVYLRGDTARVGDYGLSKLVSASRRSLSFGRGTTYYMAPEVMQRRGDHRSDIYSLGVMLYECLVGQVPFRGETEWEILKKHEAATPEYPPELTPSDRAILEACLRKDPDQRVQSVAEVMAALQASAAPRAAAANAPGPAPATRTRTLASPWAAEPRRGSGRRKLPILLLLFAVMLAVYTIRRARSGPRELARAMATTVRDAAAAVATMPPYATSRAPVAAPKVAIVPTPPAPPTNDFEARLDAAITALQRLRDARVTVPEVRARALDAVGATLRNLDLKGIRGQDPWTEALVQAVKAGLEHDEVRARWGELMRALVPGDR